MTQSSGGASSGPLYSVCMLCSNDVGTVKQSIESILELSRYRSIEVIVTDNKSGDGSEQVLKDFEGTGAITVIERKCNRGIGRELAFRASRGEYVLSHMDCDDVFNAGGINGLIDTYHATFEGKALMTKRKDSAEASNITIAPRGVLDRIGGWRSLNWGEDWDLWARLASAGLYAFLPYPMDNPPHSSIKVRTERYTGRSRGFIVRVAKYSDALRTGRRVFDPGEHVSVVQRVAFAVAKSSVRLRGSSLAPVPDPGFKEDNSG